MRIASDGARRGCGFTIVELLVAIAIIGVLASAGIPILLSARVHSVEGAVISQLRSICTAQQQFRQGRAVDDDLDGIGEFGTFAEMTGRCPLNLRASGNGSPVPLDPSALGLRFQAIGAGVPRHDRGCQGGILQQVQHGAEYLSTLRLESAAIGSRCEADQTRHSRQRRRAVENPAVTIQHRAVGEASDTAARLQTQNEGGGEASLETQADVIRSRQGRRQRAFG